MWEKWETHSCHWGHVHTVHGAVHSMYISSEQQLPQVIHCIPALSYECPVCVCVCACVCVCVCACACACACACVCVCTLMPV